MVRSSTNSYAYASHSNNRPDTNQSSIEMRDREARLADSLRRNRPLRWHTVSAGRETLPAYAEFGADVPPTPVQPEPAHVANPAAAPPPASAPQNQDLEAQNERPVRYPRYYGRIEGYIACVTFSVTLLMYFLSDIEDFTENTGRIYWNILTSLQSGLAVPLAALCYLGALRRGNAVDLEIKRYFLGQYTREELAERGRKLRREWTWKISHVLPVAFLAVILYAISATGFVGARDKVWQERVRAGINGTLVLGPDGGFQVKNGTHFNMAPSYSWFRGF